jgi:peptidoglycan/LPS O-acetylase OafA/YrhL
MQTQRIEALDYLRGLMAISIMTYHFCSWSGIAVGPDTLLGRFGIYGVPMFYLISGASLFTAHRKFSLKTDQILSFFKRRIYRIAPAYLIACFLYLVILKAWKHYDAWSIITNITITFGFLNYTKGIPAGAWSIGNEVCFYIAFPILIIPLRRTYISIIVALASAAILFYFAWFMIDSDKSLSKQWTLYIHPANQIFFFVAGMFISKIHFITEARPKNTYLWALLGASLVGIWLALPQSSITDLVSGNTRIAMSAFCIAACYACMNLQVSGDKLAEKVLRKLGEISYSLYILHGALFFAIPKFLYKGIFKGLSPTEFSFGIVYPAVILLAFYCYTYIEKPFIQFGRRRSDKSNKVLASGS